MLRILYGLIVLLGTVFGVAVAFQVPKDVLDDIPGFAGYSQPQLLLAILLGGLGYLVTATLSWELERWFEKQLPRLRMKDIVWGSVGLVCGVTVAALALVPLYLFASANPIRQALEVSSLYQTASVLLPPFLMIFFGYLGMVLFLKKQPDASDLFSGGQWLGEGSRPKVLDTSVILDGRILDLLKSGIVEGPLVVPQFVLGEMQYISDAQDQHKRQRGRRGFEILEGLKALKGIAVSFAPDTCPQLPEVDAKLLHVTREMKAVLFTNDMNLHKLARLQELPCVNLHEVSNALRPVILPGEELEIQIVKKGKEARQGVGYLNDGTMIVVENGASYLGSSQRVAVTSVLQTSAGRMIFARVDSVRPSVMVDHPVPGSQPRE
ncbi:MAG: PIN domain nuclease [Candidatus Riflebacteria bacterium]|nr:PIN domain nuclease [Candidatus Riflebacteria bacterium]